jgi:hypothetical protein
MLMGIYGNVGSGKTALIVYIASKSPNVPIKSNFKINLPQYQPLEVSELLTLEPQKEGLFVIMDEAYVWMESRLSPSKLNRYVSYVGFQSRKRNLDIICTAQIRGTLDTRFRTLEHITVYAHDRPHKKTDDFRYTFFTNSGLKHKIFKIDYDVMKNVLFHSEEEKLYDSMEVVLPPDIEDLQTEMEIANPVRLNEKVDSAINKLPVEPFLSINNFKDITHDFTKELCLRYAINFILEPYIYVRLRATIQRLGVQGLKHNKNEN